MNTAMLSRIFLYTAAVVMILVLVVAHLAVSDGLRLSAGRIALLSGDTQSALDEFSGLTGSLFHGKEAELGFAIAAVLDSSEEADLVYITREADAEPFALDLLLMNQLRSGNYPRCLQLAGLARNFIPRRAQVFRTASLLELHRFDEARQSLAELEADGLASPLIRRIRQALVLIDDGAVRIVRDRHGEIIAGVTSEGEYLWVDEEYPQLVQPLLRRTINRQESRTSLRLTLDIDLSADLEQLLDERQGSIVILQPGTNQLLVAVSDEESREDMGESSSPAFEQQLEPASISKLITTVASLRAGIDPDERLKGLDSRPAVRYEGGILYNPAQLGLLDGLNQAMAGSCNVAFAELGTDLGWQPLVGELRNFGFDSHLGNPFDLGHVLKSTGTERELADLSIGLEHTVITPLHCALIAAVFANDGLWMEPVFIAAEDGLLGYSPQPLAAPEAKPVVDPDWLPTIHESMRAVTKRGGTARGISPRGFPVAMKTGTGGGSWEHGFHINYIGFATHPDAEAVFAVRITNVRRSRDARYIGFHTTNKILRELKRRTLEKSLW